MMASKAKAVIGAGMVLVMAGALSGCTTIREKRGYMMEDTLISVIQPGLDDKVSVERTLGRPSFTNTYGQETWFYVSSMTARKPFRSPKIKEHDVVSIHFDRAGNVVSVERAGLEQVVLLNPDRRKTPTLGKQRSFLQDLFGNIGAVGAAPGGAGGM